jgi:CRISPR-associated protein (TIGR02584 family)
MKNILLAVVGLSPQVITETLFALHQNNHPVHEIRIITTRRGKEEIFAHLLASGKGMFHQYLAEYDLDGTTIRFGPETIHTVTDRNGAEIDDIETEDHNENLLELCLSLTFKRTGQRDSAVFFSVAGGRKTMGSCLTLAAQLYGRPQDRIYHVLVTPEFESNRDFYYIPRRSRMITLHDHKGQPYFKSTSFARITLVPIPFVSIRDRIAPNMMDQPLDPATLMLSLVKEDDYHLEINLIDSKLIYKNKEMDISPARLALYAFFALLKKNCPLNFQSCGQCTDCYVSTYNLFEKQEMISNLYRKVAKTKDLNWMSDSGILGLNAENFLSYKNKIKKDLEKGFGMHAAPELIITSVGDRPNTRYGLPIEKHRLKVIM